MSRHQHHDPYVWLQPLIVLIVIGAVGIGAFALHTIEASLVTSTGQGWALVAAGALGFVPLFGLLLWTTGNLRKEWKQAWVQNLRARSTETILHQSEERYRILYEDNPSMYFTLDLAGTVLSVNRVGAEQLGYAADELIGKPVLTVFHEDDKPAVRQQLASLLERPGQAGSWQLRKVRKDGTVMWVQEDARAVRDADGDLMILVICHDVTDYKRAAEALAASEKRLRTILEAEPECVKVLAEDCTLLDMNAAGLAMIEADDLDQVRGQSVCPIVSPAYRDAFAEFTRRVYHGEPGIMQFEIVGLKGRRLWMETHAVPLRDERNATIGVLAITRDSTDRKRAEEALRQSREQLQAIWENSPAIMFIKDRQGRYLDVNPPFLKLTRLPREQILGKTDADIFPPDQAASFRANDLRVLGVDHPQEFEEIAEHTDGLHTSLVSKFPLRGAQDQTYAICGIATDITERTRAEEALRFSEQRYRELVGSLDGIVWEADPTDFRILYMSPQVERLLGYTPTQWLNQEVTWKDAIHQEDFPMVVATCQREVEACRNHALEYRMRAADGRIVWIRDVTTVVLERGRVVKLRGMLLDITDRKQAEEALWRSEQALRLVLQEREQFARDLHDRIIQSIYAIGFTLEQCRRLIQGAPAKASQKLGEVITDLNRVIRDVRNYILAPSAEPPSLTTEELISSLQRLTGFMERSKGVRFHLTIDPEAAAALAANQRPQLLSIAQEAMSNSLRHSRASTASVSLRLKGDWVCFEVSDDGVGFNPQAIKPESRGLRNIDARAKKLGATFKIISGPGNGTQIRLDVPRSEQHGRESGPRSDNTGKPPRAHV